MIERGISCEAAFGDTDKGDRNRYVASFKARKIRALACYGLFTTGFNAKHVDMIAMARATKSRGLYIQIAGRGTRLFPGKIDCLFQDFGGNIARHGPIDNPNPIKGKSGTGGTAPIRNCTNCGSTNHAAARNCFNCGFVFPEPESKVATTASTLDIMSSRTDLTPEWVRVTDVSYYRHKGRDGKPDSIKVTYRAGLLFYNEWIALEHTGPAKYKAISWWRRRAPAGSAVPSDIGEAISLVDTLDIPAEIAVRPDGQWTRIVGHRYFSRDLIKAA